MKSGFRHMQTGRRIAAFVLAVILLFGAGGLNVSAAGVKNGWDSTKTHYYVNGKMAKGQRKIDGFWYYFDKSDGTAVKSSFQYIDTQNKTCYYDKDGHMLYGQQKIGGRWYYLHPKNGARKENGFQYIADQKKTCYYDAQGRMLYNLQKIGGKYYYLTPVTGARAESRFVTIAGRGTCWFDANGYMATGQRRINGYWYYFDPGTGAMKKSGFQRIANQNKTVYYDQNGHMVYGIKTIKGVMYEFDKKTGALQETMMAHASGTETGGGYYGKAGDQTGTEVCVRSWYYRPWNCVLRAKNPAMREKIAVAMERAAANDKIGYDMIDRNTLYYAAKKTGWDPGKVTTLCETDCSALVSLACIYAGVKPTVLFQDKNSSTTGTLRSRLLGTGQFECYTSKTYTNGTSKLIRGDILLYEWHHTGVVTGKFRMP